jgi:hypothetical protein
LHRGGNAWKVPSTIGNCGNGDLIACPYTLTKVLERIIPNTISKVTVIAAALANFN